MWAARAFVTIIFLALAAAFFVSTWTFVRTFAEADWRSLLLMHSHQFLFFPTFGLLALVAFYVPAVVFTHMYWTRQVRGKFARTRFIAGFLVAVLIAGGVAATLDGTRPLVPAAARHAIWELPPSAIAFSAADVRTAVLPLTERADPPRSVPCDQQGAPRCRTMAPRDVAVLLRAQSQENIGFSKLVRDCDTSELVEVGPAEKAGRFCFPARAWLNAADCCRHQTRFQLEIAETIAKAGGPNIIARVERVMLPAKVFFVIVLMAIAVMLIVWRSILDSHYRRHSRALSRGLLVGSLAMVAWPLMDYGYFQTSQLLYGDGDNRAGLPLRLSFVMVPWAGMITYYFLNRLLARPSRRLELSVQIIGGAIGFATFFGSGALMNLAQRFFSAGAYPWTIELCAGLTVLGFLYLAWRAMKDRRRRDAGDAAGDDGNPESPSAVAVKAT